MRISRSLQLYQDQGTLHMFWRCHNKEYYLTSNHNKALYMQSIKDSLVSSITHNNVFIHAFCVMSNHYHQSSSYKVDSKYLSNYMRQAHGLFGARYNRAHKRSGKVAESRPKTSLIEDTNHEMKVHFYIEANPVRAGICKLENLHLYKYSSYRFYGYGKHDENTHILTVPKWYTELGKTAKERQKVYRRLFREYLEEEKNVGIKISVTLYKEIFIGTIMWVEEQKKRISSSLKDTS